MSTSVQTLIEGAYSRSSNNDPGKLATDGELVGHLARIYPRTWALIARARPDQFSSVTTATLTGSPPAATISGDIVDILNVLDVAGSKVNVIPITEQFRTWHLAPCVYRKGASIVSRNKAGDPTAGQVLTVVQLDAPAPLALLADVLDSRYPSRHYQLLVDMLANYIGTKDAGRSPQDRAALLQELKESAAALQAEYQLRPADVSWMHASVERGGVDSRLGGS